MNIFREHYWTYKNFKSMYYKTRKYTFGKVFDYDINKEHQIINKTNILLEGGNIEQIVEKYSDIVNIQIDKTSSSEIELMVVNINSQITCGMVVLDKERKIATIHDLISEISCLKRQTSKPIMEKIIEIIKKICKKMGMKYIVLSDTSTHTCKGTKNSFKLSLANTLTSGEPYYYKYGFKYIEKENDQIVRSNREIIKGMRTENLEIKEIEIMLRYVLKNIKKKDEYIEDKIKNLREIYKRNISKYIGEFFKEIKYTECELFSHIYINLAMMINLNFYASNKQMYFEL